MVRGYRKARELVNRNEYGLALQAYYDALRSRFYGPLTKELLYLKRLAKVPLEGRDVLAFSPESSRTETVANRLGDYVRCIDNLLALSREEGRRTPLDVLAECVPTMEELVETRNAKYSRGVNLFNGGYERETFEVTEDHFTQMWDKCPSGELFDRYPDPVIYCRAVEEWEYPEEYFGFWITYAPEQIQRNVYSKGLHINWLDVYMHREWRFGSAIRHPDFTAVNSLDEVRKETMTTSVLTCNEPGGIRFTGRHHTVESTNFYEIDVLWRGDFQTAQVVANPFLEIVEEILREAENSLREYLGLPRIGEGWVQETRLFHLLSEFYADAQHHASPPWLKPQHLDIYVASQNIAIEYHGRQHFEPVQFFGGEEAFERTRMRDRRKTRLCAKNRVKLLVWRYDEPIRRDLLVEKLERIGIATR